MGIQSLPPEDLPKSTTCKRWDYNPVPGTALFRGFLAGDPFGAYVHYFKTGSKPCTYRMSKKTLKCPHCAKGLIYDWRGYTPYYDEQYQPKFVMITFGYLESVSEIKHLEQVHITRGKLATDPVVITQKNFRATPIPHKAHRVQKVDLGEFLTHVLWGDEQLAAWDRSQPRSLPGMADPAPTEPVIEDEGLRKMRALLAREKEQQERTEHAGELAGHVLRRATTPKPNGRAFRPAE